MTQATLYRFAPENTKQPLGLFSSKEFNCVTLELADKQNQRNISCIPKGYYNLQHRTSSRFKQHFLITAVTNRSYILIHSGNYNSNTKGCILVGDGWKDFNKDGYRDVTNSRKTLDKIFALLPQNTTILIK